MNNFKDSRPMQFGLLAIIFLFSYHLVPHSEASYFWRLPPLLKDIPVWINTLLDNLMFQWFAVDVWDPVWKEYEPKSVFRIITRAIGSAILFLIILIRELFLGGTQTIGALFSDAMLSTNKWLYWPALPWTAVVAGAAILGYQLQGIRLALLAGIGVGYLCVFGQWEPSLETLSFVLVCAPICFILGLGFGIWGYLNRTVEAALEPLLNCMQTLPHFSYLVPVMVLFGIGDHAGAVATIIFATPPMIRLTILGLRKISPDIVDSGLMSGCSKFQLLFRVLIPTARTDILIGVNQVIMQCLAMTTIAAFIGARGLGFNLKVALNSLEIGKASEIGLCVVLIAVILDKYSLAWANKQKDYFSDLNFFQRYRPYIGFILLTLLAILLAYIGALYFKDGINYLYYVPFDKGFTISPFIDAGIDWFWEAFFPYLNGFNVWLITSVLVPMRDAYLGMPVISTFILVMGAGYIVGGVRSAIVVGGLILFIALSEYWDRALITAYMATFAVLISAVLGLVVGSICAQNRFTSKTILSVCDFFQTFPSFIYLIPVILLFGITDTSVMIAAIVYAVIPATRYTVEGLNSVPISLHEAATMSGVSRLQRWTNIELPLALPHIMLGINQTVIFALFMVILGALIGTIDLGQIIMGALSKKGGAGIGLTLGIFVSFMCLAVDNLIQTWAKERKKLLGID
ncbi:MAG: ABC transporter permease subunit [Proteobacteria bacterium]|nr:ABC transporter permease subunit [Pseudomonadota bacterium]MBT6350273.1 ABC transporter permease subunit [Pseudomonadota bacterium]MBT7561813.1 ABC transporter permease subunit [Pseudomonadota bacterium]